MDAATGKTRLFRIRFIHAVRKGLTAAEIAARLQVTVGSVRARAKSYGMALAIAPRGRRLPFGISQRDLEEIGGDDAVDFGAEGVA